MLATSHRGREHVRRTHGEAQQAVVADERARAGLEDSADGRLHGQIREHPLDGALAERREGAVVCLCGPVPLPHGIQ